MVMPSNKATPGPWMVVTDPADFGNQYAIHATRSDDPGYPREKLARTLSAVPEAEQEANARLMALAPALVTILRTLVGGSLYALFCETADYWECGVCGDGRGGKIKGLPHTDDDCPVAQARALLYLVDTQP